ncbi:MAG: hypothetical protein L0Z48_07125 [candidate division Zixibacteria bacterium]|nr:hypothetical protein [candidate division Zixibacteria bacterium]MCI0596299.1 hypothetical protein [candidate division Zixibacteria bacterium]
MQFKHDTLRRQFYDLNGTDPRLRAVISELDFFFQQKFGRELVITSVGRTEEEQKELYPEFFARVGRVHPSAHLGRPCRAVDIRSRDLSADEVQALREYFESWWEELPGWAFLINDRGGALPHIHIQVGRKI